MTQTIDLYKVESRFAGIASHYSFFPRSDEYDGKWYPQNTAITYTIPEGFVLGRDACSESTIYRVDDRTAWCKIIPNGPRGEPQIIDWRDEDDAKFLPEPKARKLYTLLRRAK